MAIKVSREFLEQMLSVFNSQLPIEEQLVLVNKTGQMVEPKKEFDTKECLGRGDGKTVDVGEECVFDTEDLYICVYNKEYDPFYVGSSDLKVGVFKKKDVQVYCEHMPGIGQISNEATIYESMFSETKEIGMFLKRTKLAKRWIGERTDESWQNKGFVINGCVATCNMNQVESFEDIRLNLKIFNQLGEFKPGKATLSEIKEVLAAAPDYLGLGWVKIDESDFWESARLKLERIQKLREEEEEKLDDSVLYTKLY